MIFEEVLDFIVVFL